jgi:hypothetical protein
MIEHQVALLVRPPDFGRDDARYDEAMEAWARRLAKAVKAGVLDEARADLVWRSEVSRGA